MFRNLKTSLEFDKVIASHSPAKYLRKQQTVDQNRQQRNFSTGFILLLRLIIAKTQQLTTNTNSITGCVLAL